MSMSQDEIDALIEGGVENVEAEEETQIAQAGLDAPHADESVVDGGMSFLALFRKWSYCMIYYYLFQLNWGVQACLYAKY